jgi:hypothetical protein
MKMPAVLALALSLFAAGCLGPPTRPTLSVLPYAEIYQRATDMFDYADFLKPAEIGTNELGFTLAPLILQQVRRAEVASLPRAELGALDLSNGVPVLEPGRPTVYWDIDTVQINGKSHAQFTYVWFDSTEPQDRAHAQIGSVPTDRAKAGLALQGVRITLNSSGQPAIWEVRSDASGASVFFVSHSLEAAAAAEYGKPLPRRRYAIERSTEASPEAVVARVIDDGPVAMGPILYLSASRGLISTVICRCMPAQAKKIVSSGTYQLLPWRSTAAGLLSAQSAATLKAHGAFWPGEPTRDGYLESCLRVPRAF